MTEQRRAESHPAAGPTTGASTTPELDLARCDICGSTDLREIRCKLICGNCKTILQTCADL